MNWISGQVEYSAFIVDLYDFKISIQPDIKYSIRRNFWPNNKFYIIKHIDNRFFLTTKIELDIRNNIRRQDIREFGNPVNPLLPPGRILMREVLSKNE